MTSTHGDAAVADIVWARGGAIVGIVALLSYIGLNVVSVPGPVAVLLSFGFAFGLTVASIGIHLGVTRSVAPRLSLLAAVGNSAGAATLLAMLLVQLAVKAAQPHPGAALTGVWLGLDVAWDLLAGAGTVCFGLALWWHEAFRPITAGLGVAAGVLIMTLNVATFPTPPAEAGLFDAGPLVGLWYFWLMIRVLLVSNARRAA